MLQWKTSQFACRGMQGDDLGGLSDKRAAGGEAKTTASRGKTYIEKRRVTRRSAAVVEAKRTPAMLSRCSFPIFL
jgi:hypothetical protein